MDPMTLEVGATYEGHFRVVENWWGKTVKIRPVGLYKLVQRAPTTGDHIRRIDAEISLVKSVTNSGNVVDEHGHSFYPYDVEIVTAKEVAEYEENKKRLEREKRMQTLDGFTAAELAEALTKKVNDNK
mgnify:CR=1 FL=1